MIISNCEGYSVTDEDGDIRIYIMMIVCDYDANDVV